MRGVGRGDLEAMQDIAVTPEVICLGIFFAHKESAYRR